MFQLYFDFSNQLYVTNCHSIIENLMDVLRNLKGSFDICPQDTTFHNIYSLETLL